MAGGLFAAAMLLLAGCIGDCFGYGELESQAYLGAGSATLDAAHPIAEQRISVRLNAAALPAGVATTATFEIRPDPDAQPLPSLGAAPASTAPPAIVPEVTIIQDDTNTIVPSTVSWSSPTAQYQPVFASIPIDCPPATACEQGYRVRVAAPSLRDGERLSVSWIAQAKVVWTGATGTCGRPEGASVKIEQTAPKLFAADESAFATAVATDEKGANLIARHVTVASDGPVPSAASMRISTLQLTAGEGPNRNWAWRQWVRVLPDKATTPVADALVGQEPYSPAALQGGTLDVPVVGDCPAGEPCRRGYWVVFQNFPPAQPRPGERANSVNVGRFAWSASATATYAGRTGSPGLAVRIDAVDSGLPAQPTVTKSAAAVTLVTNKVATALDVTITVPERPPPANGIDPLAASAAVVNVSGHGVRLVTEVRGDGAGPIKGGFNGDGTTNLIAHPFGACAVTGACTATLQLVGTFHVESSGSQADSASLLWGIELLGAPATTTVTFGAPHELAPPAEPSAGLGTLAGLVLLLAVLVVLWWRRRARRVDIS